MADEGRKRKMQRKKGANLMKNLFKKIGALLVAAVMVLSMCTAVFAEGPTAEIRIKNAGTNATFDYLQVIVPDTQKETGWAFATPAIAEKYKTAFNEQNDQTIIKKMIVLESANTKYKGTEPATTGQIENALEAVLGDNIIMNAATKAATAPITILPSIMIDSLNAIDFSPVKNSTALPPNS